MNKFYVYALVNPIDSSYIYIGKGQGKRLKRHVGIARNPNNTKYYKNNPHLYNKIRTILNCGYSDLKYEYLAKDLPDIEAYALEAAYIEYHRDTILNIQSGGVSHAPWTGKKHSQATKDKVRQGVYNSHWYQVMLQKVALRNSYPTYEVMQCYLSLMDQRKQRDKGINRWVCEMNKAALKNAKKKVKQTMLNDYQALIDLHGCRTEERVKNVIGRSSCYVYAQIAKGNLQLYKGEQTQLELEHYNQCKQNQKIAANKSWIGGNRKQRVITDEDKRNCVTKQIQTWIKKLNGSTNDNCVLKQINGLKQSSYYTPSGTPTLI